MCISDLHGLPPSERIQACRHESQAMGRVAEAEWRADPLPAPVTGQSSHRIGWLGMLAWALLSMAVFVGLIAVMIPVTSWMAQQVMAHQSHHQVRP